MKASIIKDGKVVNIAKVADAKFAESQGWIVSDTAKIGDSYDAETGEFVTPPPPPEPVPRSISRRQGKQQLIIDDLDEAVETAIANVTDIKQRKLLQAWYNDADPWERDNQYLQQLGTELGLTDEQIDTMFKEASKL